MLQCMSDLQVKSNAETTLQSLMDVEKQADEVLKAGQSLDDERWLNIEDYLVSGLLILKYIFKNH